MLFDNIKGHAKGFRIITGAILDAQRLGLTLGYSDIYSDHELVSRLEGKVIDWERRASEFPAVEVSEGPLLENRAYGNDVNLLKFPIPKWHEHDGGRYLGTGCIVITRDPDTGVVNLGTYRLMVHDEKTLALHISSAHHGALNIKKYHARGGIGARGRILRASSAVSRAGGNECALQHVRIWVRGGHSRESCPGGSG